MRFLKRLLLKRLLGKLQTTRRDSYTPDDALRVLTALRTVINSDNPIEYFSVRRMLDVRFQVQTLRAVELLETVTEINTHLMEESGSLPEARVTYRYLQDAKVLSLYDWLVDGDDNVLDVPEFYTAFANQIMLLCDLVFQADEIDRNYILRKLTPLYTELLTVFAGTLECGLRST